MKPTALSAITNNNNKIATHDDNSKEKIGECIKYNNKSFLVGGKVYTSPRDGDIYVETLSGMTVSLYVDFNDTLDQVKARIPIEGVSPDQTRFVLDDKQLEDEQMTTAVIVALHFQSNHIAPKYDRDFTDVNDNGETFMRGDFRYKRPCGWKRFAINVLDKYEDNIWLGADKSRQFPTSSVQDEWPVSYHGTAEHNCNSIARDGNFSCKKPLPFGYRFYSTPDIDVASKYAIKFTYEGDDYLVVFQNRVNPENLIRISNIETGIGEY
ncbi:ubiquitin-ribosomal 60S subunit protein L40B fusion protein [Rhizophagus irregularis DAOM 197198w]|uniref:Ubiquitin-ribosomal 60S subunit protein L40B fusion protein n=1 Tax=Rhizophagus irregularis (strain DAOM 197198w) TaxID=1432141 RepID=A0A015KVB0_RHIIW|nr:ubiquitin-ribosomal 60S subunit protein L40B fusion protein [Rhizophagus irregularis DAOM 197198w]